MLTAALKCKHHINLPLINDVRFLSLRKFCRSVENHESIPKTAQRVYDEETIPVPWGYLSAKWWGPKTGRPILGLHGWQDNSGSFDRLAPLLPQHVGFLTVDLPGHGLSSRLPRGMFYNAVDNVYVMRLIMEHFNWEKVSFLNHSMSSVAGFLFSASYPEKIDMMIGIDTLKPPIVSVEQNSTFFGRRVDDLLWTEKREAQGTEPPNYTYKEAIERLHTGSRRSVDRESCKYLLERNLQKSKKDPNKYFFTRDPRLKIFGSWHVTQPVCLHMAEKISAPYMFIKATKTPYYEAKENSEAVIDVMRKHNPKFQYVEIDGTHHVHLNEPEKVAAVVNPFILKYRPTAE